MEFLTANFPEKKFIGNFFSEFKIVFGLDKNTSVICKKNLINNRKKAMWKSLIKIINRTNPRIKHCGTL